MVVLSGSSTEAQPRQPASAEFAISPWTTRIYDNELALYKTIRTHAPNSHVMLFSPSCFNSPIKAREAVEYATARGVDWAISSFAIHGYGQGGNMEPVIRGFQ